MKLSQFSELETIFENNLTLVQKGKLAGQYYILKSYKSKTARFKEEKIAKETTITAKLIPVTTSTTDNNGMPILVKPYVEGIPLADFMANWRFDSAVFLKIAIGLIQNITSIHEQNILHLDLNPTNIIYNPVNEGIEIIDFGSANLFQHKSTYLGNPERVECDLNYIAPEQTGRINRIVDFSTDLYACGGIFYKLATGKKVFLTDDPLELVHSHIAKAPDNPCLHNKELAEPLGQIILKLLAKNAEDRYQSNLGLLIDLEKCAQQYQEHKKIATFSLGEQDVSDKFRISQKTYGRGAEIATLESVVERVYQGNKEYVLISGVSGSGKSNLVSVIHKQLAKQRATFIKGKFDQVNRNIPYFAWVQAFNNFVELLITENEERIDYWKKRLQTELGDNLSYLSQIVPNLKWLFKDLDKAQITFTAETQNRFRYAIRSFIQCMASEAHPLIVFLDDWQWADNASIELLNATIGDEETQHLLFIGAFRDNEISPDHSFQSTLGLLKRDERAYTIHLENLTKVDTLALLQDTFNVDNQEVKELNDLIYDRTEGNALYFVQFLTALREENLLHFNVKKRQWIWDIATVKQTVVSDNIVELLVRKIKKYTPAEQEILQTAACIGGRFELDILALASSLSEQETEKLLNRALREGLIYTNSNLNVSRQGLSEIKKDFRFAHDRIQQGVYVMLEAAAKVKNHYEIGRILLEKWTDEQLRQNIFSVTNHLNKGLPENRDVAQKNKIAVLNLAAGQKAKLLIDFENSFEYVEKGIEVLASLSKDADLNARTELYLQRYELGYLLSKEAEVFTAWEAALTNSDLTPLANAKLQRIKINGLVAKGEFEQAVNQGIAYLAVNGFKIKKKPNKLDIIFSAIRTSRTYNKKKIGELVNLPIITDPFTLEFTEIIQSVNGAAYFSNQDLWALITIETARFYIKKGLCSLAAFTFISYGATLIIATKDFKSGTAFGKLALAIFERLDTTENLNKSLFSYHTLISYWESHINVSNEGMQEALNLSLANGDFLFVGHCLNIISGNHTTIGENLIALRKTVDKNFKTVKLSNEYTNMTMVKIYGQYVYSLSDPENSEGLVEGDLFNFENQKQEQYDKSRNVLIYSFYACSLKMKYFVRDYRGAYDFDQKIDTLGGDLSLGTFVHYSTKLFRCLVKGALFISLDAKKQKKERKEIRSILKDFKKCKAAAPVNFENKYELIKGIWLKINGKTIPALSAFHRATELANQHNFVQEEAVSWEACADIYMELEQEVIARTYYQAAYNCYAKTGAYAVCNRMENDFVWLKKGQKEQTALKDKNSAASANMLASLDLETVLKSSEVLIGETDFEKLLRKLILIAIENAGAEKGYLLLKTNGKLTINAYGDVDKETKIFEQLPLANFSAISKKVVKYVDKTKQILILADAANDEQFMADAYLKEYQVKSIFALPILSKGVLIGLLYLENNLITNAFTAERVELLRLLSGQISISIENTLLIENLEEKVRERTLAIEKEKQTSDNLLLNILPKATADELRTTGKAAPKFYQEVSVLFLDFKKFSDISRKLDYKQLVEQIDDYFKAFDEILAIYHIEKIKTIGDAYMCACGLPIERTNHATLIVKAAMHFQKIISDLKVKRQASGLSYFEARVGIHSGPVVAGVVGSKKFAYDIWGDTVNVASRMESACAVGEIAISEQTYTLVKAEISCLHQGTVNAKNIGELEMYYIEQ